MATVRRLRGSRVRVRFMVHSHEPEKNKADPEEPPEWQKNNNSARTQEMKVTDIKTKKLLQSHETDAGGERPGTSQHHSYYPR